MSSKLLTQDHFNIVEKHLLERKSKDSDFLYNISVSEIKETMKQIRLISIDSVSYQNEGKVSLDVSILKQEYLKPINIWTVKLSLIELYKALNCIDYQIEVEFIKRHRELTKEEIKALELFEKITYKVADYYIGRLDEYNNAKWSL